MGCLIPQDDQVLPELPPKKNSPPRIVVRTPATTRVEFKQSASCSNEPFSLQVEDVDTRDVLRSFWFIDKSPSSQPFQPNNVTSMGNAVRTITEPTSNLYKATLQNLTVGTHLLTVYVVDSEIEEIVGGAIVPSQYPVALPDGQTAMDRGAVDEHSWVLEVAPCP